MRKKIDMCVYNEIVHFVLQTVSSEDYLKDIGFYRPKAMGKVEWKKFAKRVNNQTVKPGIYPRKVGRGSVHYYGVKEEFGKMVVANGYPTKSPKTGKNMTGGVKVDYWHGMNAQAYGSHGLCQVFALMFMEDEDDGLRKGKQYYFENVKRGFRFLRDFIESDPYRLDRCWSVEELDEEVEIKCTDDYAHYEARLAFYDSMDDGENGICLSTMIKRLLSYPENLKYWFSDDE